MAFTSSQVGGRGVRGFGDVRRRLFTLMKEYPKETAQSAKKVFGWVKDTSVARTPELTGDLKKSHRVLEPVISRGIIHVEIQVGEGLGIYPIIQHEDVTLEHPRGGEAKFLEKSIKEWAPYLAGHIAKDVDLRRASGG